MISSKDIEDPYLSEIVSVSKILRISVKEGGHYFEQQLKKHKLLANRKFYKSTKKDLFRKAYGFVSGVDTSNFKVNERIFYYEGFINI